MAEIIDLNKAKTENNGEVKESAPQDLELKIILTPSGEMKVYGPITDEILCLGLMEKAKQVVMGHNIKLKMDERKIVKPSHGIIDFMRRKH